MLSQAIQQQFNQPVFSPMLVGECESRTATVLVMGYAEYQGQLIILNAVGNNTDINNLMSTARARIGVNIIVVPTDTGRKALFRYSETDFEMREKEVEGYGIKSLVIINRELLIPGFGRNEFFACDTIEKAVEMVGERIKASLDTSVIPAWYEYIFNEGLRSEHIKQLPGSGVRAYHIDTDAAYWQSVISSGLASNILTF